MLCGHQGCPKEGARGYLVPTRPTSQAKRYPDSFYFFCRHFPTKANRTQNAFSTSNLQSNSCPSFLRCTSRDGKCIGPPHFVGPFRHPIVLMPLSVVFFFFFSLPHSRSSYVKGNPSRQFNGQRPRRHQYPRSGSECMTERRPSSYPYPSRAGETGHCG